MPDSPLIDSLRRAVDESPSDVPLRLHLAEILLDAGRGDEAVGHLASVLALDPGSSAARGLMIRALTPAPDPASALRPGAAPGSDASPGAAPGSDAGPGAASGSATAPRPGAAAPPVHPAGRAPGAGGRGDPGPRHPAAGSAAADGPPVPGDPAGEFDWQRAEADLWHVAPPMFLDGDDPPAPGAVDRAQPRLADVGGMDEVKARLEAAFLAPLRNPDLRRLYGKSLRGGLLLYGPPGCGKTFLARAVAGELGAGFLAVSLADVLDMYIGQSERNLHDVFELARRSAPCVVFLDELDAIGQKRTHLRHSGMRSTVNQLLHELDGVGADNQGVFVLAATNAPWDVDPALRRPGRLDRTLLVLPPDGGARAEILRHHLRDRPVTGVDLHRLAARTEGLSGADLAHMCETAAERALLDSARTGTVRTIGMADLEAARRDVQPSTGPWFDSARNVALFANEGGQYDELLAYLEKRRLV